MVDRKLFYGGAIAAVSGCALLGWGLWQAAPSIDTTLPPVPSTETIPPPVPENMSIEATATAPPDETPTALPTDTPTGTGGDYPLVPDPMGLGRQCDKVPPDGNVFRGATLLGSGVTSGIVYTADGTEIGRFFDGHFDCTLKIIPPGTIVCGNINK